MVHGPLLPLLGHRRHFHGMIDGSMDMRSRLLRRSGRRREAKAVWRVGRRLRPRSRDGWHLSARRFNCMQCLKLTARFLAIRLGCMAPTTFGAGVHDRCPWDAVKPFAGKRRGVRLRLLLRCSQSFARGRVRARVFIIIAALRRVRMLVCCCRGSVG
jgi:hypothetical protein